MEMPSDGLKGPFPEARAQAKSFESILAVRAVQPRIVVALETPVLDVGLSGGIEKACLRDWRFLDHRSHESCAISPARTRFPSCSPPARGKKNVPHVCFQARRRSLGPLDALGWIEDPP